MQETRVWSLGREDPLEKWMATHPSILAWRSPWTEGPGGLQSTGSQRVGRDWVANTCTFTSLGTQQTERKVLTERLHGGHYQSNSVQLRSTLCDPMDCSAPGLPVHHQLPEFTQTHAHWVSDAIQPSHPLSPPSPLPWIFPSVRVFSNESALRIRWPKYWSFSFSISPSNDHSGLISFRMDWVDLSLQLVMDRESWRAAVHGDTTEQLNWTEDLWALPIPDPCQEDSTPWRKAPGRPGLGETRTAGNGWGTGFAVEDAMKFCDLNDKSSSPVPFPRPASRTPTAKEDSLQSNGRKSLLRKTWTAPEKRYADRQS